MKTILISLSILLSTLVAQNLQAQINIQVNSGIDLKIENLEKQKEQVQRIEKKKLRTEVEAITKRLHANEISEQEAEILKKAAAEKRAMNIENQLDIIDANIALLKRNANTEDGEETVDVYYRKLDYLKYKEDDEQEEVYDSIPKSTTSGITLAFGLNNAIIDGQSLDDSPYKIGGSRFFELGYEFETNLISSGFARIRYGLSFQFNGLKADNNQYFVTDGDQTYLEEYPLNLDKAKLRMDNLVLPLHIELGPRTLTYGKKRAYYDTSNFKIGLGGYAGVNLNTIQKLKYEENGNNRKTKLSQTYNTSNFIYGLSAYIGYDNWALYAKYDLNTIFKDNAVDQNNVSVGFRITY
ncbi:hypothetical protein ACFQ3R_08065 [Mesonia ostreae]|uniref:Outer membrane protein beta-barrel domain-containing protein n=1 Tax=Mesonia ostreae TaxID=861110 RepID=A0ABU2KFA4_9FLAO|nr:hypothetical protein [Mesonia ostreae]MDT0293374.1 hypothetical protein [Mesonia ostreae]